MDAETAKRCRSTEAVMERARLALPQPGHEAKVEFDRAIHDYREYLSHNETGLAFVALRAAAELVPSRGSVWKDLIRAAEFMELRDKIPELEKRFVAAAQPLGVTGAQHMSASSPETIDRESIMTLNFTVTSLQEQSEPWRVSQSVKEPEPWGFFAQLAPAIPPLWSDHDLTSLVPKFTGVDGMSLALAPTLRRRDESGFLVLFFPRQRSIDLPVGTRVTFTMGTRDDA
jgi:hypothetical protein